jgi:5'(3')-deoxyribonucleotidase
VPDLKEIIMRILIDMDEVMADAIERFFEWYERDFGVRYTRGDIDGTKLANIVPAEHHDIVKNYPHQPGFFKDLPVIEYSKEVIKELNDKYEVYIVSAAMEFKYSLYDKYEWLDEHFPFIHWKRRVLCGDKSVAKGDVLIDDHDFNLSVFDGRRIIFTAPHNIHITKYERLNNWKEARALFDI